MKQRVHKESIMLGLVLTTLNGGLARVRVIGWG